MAPKKPQKTRTKTSDRPRQTAANARASTQKKQIATAKGKKAQSRTRSGQSIQPNKAKGGRERQSSAQATRTQKKPSSAKAEELRKEALRKLLLSKREEIVKEVKREISKYIKGETRQLVDTALDDGDWSVVDLSEDISFKHMSTHRETLLKIDEALRKLAEGTYGICEDCGEEISEERLKILPFAIYCTDCQEQKEKLEELEKSEGLIG